MLFSHIPNENRINNKFVILCFVIHCMILLLMLSGILKPLFNDSMHRLGIATDFRVYYVAGQNFLKNKDIYGVGPAFGYRYHPVFATTICALLSMFSFQTAYLIWIILVEIFFLLILHEIFYVFDDKKISYTAALILVFFMPYYLDIYMGNSTFLVTALLTYAWLKYLKNDLKMFTIILTISILIKPEGVLFLPYLLIRKHWKIVFLILIIVLLSGGIYFYDYPGTWHYFYQVDFKPLPFPGWIVHAGNLGFHGLLTTLFTRLANVNIHTMSSIKQLPDKYLYIIKLFPVIFGLITFYFSWRYRENINICIFLWTGYYLTAYKDVWEHSYTIIILGILFLARDKTISKKWLLIGAVWLMLPTGFIIYDVPLPKGPIDPEPYWNISVSMIHHLTKPLGLLILYWTLIIRKKEIKNSQV